MLRTIYKFVHTPRDITPAELKVVFTYLSDLNIEGELQYDVAVIFDPSVMKDFSKSEHSANRFWSDVIPRGGEQKIMGAVALRSDRELVEKIIHTPNNNTNLSHPVFDSKGNIRYPLGK
ncbi:MAG: hypothetical protein V4467_00865 [Patescibacteria group bacterium]